MSVPARTGGTTPGPGRAAGPFSFACPERKGEKEKGPPGAIRSSISGSLQTHPELCSGLRHAEITAPEIAPLMGSPRGPPTTERRGDVGTQ
jgi:hypothetical protein